KVVKIGGPMSRKWGGGTCVIAAPARVDGIMARVRKGKMITINQIRQLLAKQHEATSGCTVTTCIFSWIAAHAAEEAAEEGRKRITPYWRTVKEGGELNPKYPGGIENLKKHLKAEGHAVVQRGKRFFVKHADMSLAQLK